MKNILEAPFVVEFGKITANMYRLGWDERNGGNLSLLLDEEVVAEYLDLNKVIRNIPFSFDGKELAGRIFMATGTGKYFRNVADDPERNTGIVRISEDGTYAELLWGYNDGGKMTMEFPSHMMAHIERLKIDSEHRVVMHCHPNNILAMTFVHSLDEREFTYTLWQMITESIVVFPDGVNILPWMMCGNNEIGAATAEKLKTARVCVWAQHGVYGVGKDLDEAFGLVETVEKAAEVYLKIANMPWKQTITEDQLRIVARDFKLKVREGWL